MQGLKLGIWTTPPHIVSNRKIHWGPLRAGASWFLSPFISTNTSELRLQVFARQFDDRLERSSETATLTYECVITIYAPPPVTYLMRRGTEMRWNGIVMVTSIFSVRPPRPVANWGTVCSSAQQAGSCNKFENA